MSQTSSSPPPEPPQIVSRAVERKPKPPAGADHREMQIVAANTYTTPFELPSDWIVRVKPRGPHSPIHSDTYYYEPGTGRKFRSLVSVKRHLNGEKDPTPRKRPSNCLVPYYSPGPGSFKRVIYGGKALRPDELEETHYTKLEDVHPKTVPFRSADILPDGWIVEEVPRKGGIRKDRYYFDPVTGNRFRSILEVRRFLEAQRYQSKRKALTLHNHCTAPRSSLPRKKNTSIKAFKDTLTDLMNPPKRINWVYSGDGKDNWSPLVEECVLPNYVMEQWSETFLAGMNNEWKHRIPQLTMEKSNQE